MTRTKKTTLLLDEDLLDQVKSKAVARGTSASNVVREALREYMARRDEPRSPVILPTCPGPWIAPVDINDTSAVLDYLDELDAPNDLDSLR